MIRTFSLKRMKAERQLRKIEKELDQNPINSKCFFYPSEQKSEYYHISPKSEGLKWIAMKENLLPIGRTAHFILHNGTNREIKSLPRFQEYLKKMKNLNLGYYYRYKIKLEK